MISFVTGMARYPGKAKRGLPKLNWLFDARGSTLIAIVPGVLEQEEYSLPEPLRLGAEDEGHSQSAWLPVGAENASPWSAGGKTFKTKNG